MIKLFYKDKEIYRRDRKFTIMELYSELKEFMDSPEGIVYPDCIYMTGVEPSTLHFGYHFRLEYIPHVDIVGEFAIRHLDDPLPNKNTKGEFKCKK